MNLLRPAFSLFILLTLVVGVGYPLLTTGLAELVFPQAAKGTLIEYQGQIRGSALIGQNFTRADYFHNRPSATAETPYNALASSGSNLAGSNPALDDAIKQRVAELRKANPDASEIVPVDLVTASASGLDPHISPAAAQWQMPRVAKARNLSDNEVQRLIEANTSKPLLWFIGEPVVNVLQLNIALDKLQQ